jgi:hypothetical protein
MKPSSLRTGARDTVYYPTPFRTTLILRQRSGQSTHFTEHLQQVEALRNAPACPTITADEFKSKLKIWTKSTTTPPSGLHLGNLKAIIAQHSFCSTAADDYLTSAFLAQHDELDRKQADLFDLHLLLINYPLERGYSYKRWHAIANRSIFLKERITSAYTVPE